MEGKSEFCTPPQGRDHHLWVSFAVPQHPAEKVVGRKLRQLPVTNPYGHGFRACPSYPSLRAISKVGERGQCLHPLLGARRIGRCIVSVHVFAPSALAYAPTPTFLTKISPLLARADLIRTAPRIHVVAQLVVGGLAAPFGACQLQVRRAALYQIHKIET